MIPQGERDGAAGEGTGSPIASEVQLRLLRAIYACLRPIARILLRSGITYSQFADVAKRAFVFESLADAAARGKRPNVSRVAVRTGLSRKEVARTLAGAGVPEAGLLGASTDSSGPPSKVLHEWHTNPQYLDAEGQPAVLPFDAPCTSFAGLVRSLCGDVPPSTVWTELLRAGAIERLEDGSVKAVKRYYVPGNVDEKALTTLSRMLFPLAAGIAHNSDPDRRVDGFIQRIMFADGLESGAVPVFRRMVRRRASEFLESIDDWLGATGLEAEAGTEPVRDFNVGVGVFYYEGPSADEITDDRWLSRREPDAPAGPGLPPP